MTRNPFKHPAQIVNLALAIASLVLAAHTTFPWCDELVLADNPARWAIGGSFDGRVWPCTYNFLYPALLSIWFKVFGVSHATTISLSVLAAFLTVVALLRIAERREVLKTVAKVQNYMPTFPESGYILFPSKDLKVKLDPFLEKSGYITKPIISAPYPLARLMCSQKSK